MVTTEENIQRKPELINKWKKANPGLEWSNAKLFDDEPKIYISKQILSSMAYRTLSRKAMLVYQDFLAKRIMKRVRHDGNKYWICENNGEIVFPYTEAETNGISRRDFVKTIDELQAKGFIDITHQGKGGRKPATGGGDYSTYWIDDRWENYGTDDFKLARKPRKKDTRKDRGWELYWKNKRKYQN